MIEQGLVLSVGGVVHRPAPGHPFTFGRSARCALRLDPQDVAISRIAGTIELAGEAWWLTNSSETRQLGVVDEFGFRSVLAPGRRIAVEGRLRVLVEGANGSHELTLTAPRPRPRDSGLAPAAGGEVSTSIGAEVVLRAEDRAALVALLAGYLEEGDRYDPYPKSYAAAAARLGWPRTKLVKRIEYLRNRLEKAGVPNMQGWNAMTALAEHVLAAGVISRADLRLLER
ncbi:hypothetical protein [Actinokineospora sp. NBRC 105648]|uniref:hypothetical protein n=1 Tax=Actinokineospora sp. NBRC 105648 TaxID=3032206 RepID=UPI0024A16035|nr:hypothetical protein [Actinokineospora sp. NBRC 105648]GLZ40614.1 hypothetical protein Acsp05_42380 [Actinokineospora sp. NBRC 105648]